jgi:hypothetical protein
MVPDKKLHHKLGKIIYSYNIPIEKMVLLNLSLNIT